MKTSTKILSGIVLSAVVATSVYAGHGKGECDRGYKGDSVKGKMMQKRMHKGKMGMPILSVVKELNLSDVQKDEIKKIFKEQRKNKQTLNDAFTSNSFDKAKFIDMMNTKRENMIKSKADMIEKVYAVLDSKQKQQFKTLIDLKKEKYQNRFN